MPNPVDSSVAAMQKAAADQAKLSTIQMTASATIQSSASAAQTVTSAHAAGTETTKGVANDMRSAAKAN